MICYKLTIAYEGTNYSGWQFQVNAPSIQEELQKGLAKLLRKQKVTVIGSGRTDAGVHAKRQVAHFHHGDTVDLNLLVLALNGILPKDIRVIEAQVAPDGFHARYSATGKIYHYYIHLGRVMDPFRRNYFAHVYLNFDFSLLRQAAQKFLGTHDFTSFANEAHKGASAKNPIRTLYRLDIIEEENGLHLEFEGNGFLYKMVRNITGLLIDIATGKRRLEEIEEIFQAKDRQKSSKAAPAKGLVLICVKYGKKDNFSH